MAVTEKSTTRKNKSGKLTAGKNTAKKSSAAGKKLVIVESPYKSKTIKKFLGSKYEVIATVGHVRDLPKSRLAVDIDNNYEPDYITVRGKADKVKELKNAAREASHIYLATDPDREGEAISWHLCNILEIDPLHADRIEFNEITEPAIKKAVTSPRPIDMNLVNAVNDNLDALHSYVALRKKLLGVSELHIAMLLPIVTICQLSAKMTTTIRLPVRAYGHRLRT